MQLVCCVFCMPQYSIVIRSLHQVTYRTGFTHVHGAAGVILFVLFVCLASIRTADASDTCGRECLQAHIIT